MSYYACYTKLFETSLVFVRNFIIMVMLVKFETNSKGIYYKRIIFCRDDEYIVYRTNVVVFEYTDCNICKKFLLRSIKNIINQIQWQLEQLHGQLSTSMLSQNSKQNPKGKEKEK